MRQNGEDMGQSGKDMGQSYAEGRYNTLAILRRARRRANLNRKSSGNLTHIFANLALVTLPIGLQNWNHRFAVNLSHEAQICDSIDLFRRDLGPSALRLEVRFCKTISVVTSYKHRIMNATFSP